MPPLRPALIAAALIVGTATPVQAATAPEITVENGRTQPVFSYADAIREHVYVESTVDSDADGRLDRVRVDIIRPKESGPGLRVPVIIDESPYYDNSGRGNEGERKVYDDAKQRREVPALLRQLLRAARLRRAQRRHARHHQVRRLPRRRGARPTCWAARPSSTGSTAAPRPTAPTAAPPSPTGPPASRP
ncbi:hypothetical protein ACFSTC_14260 [Nonomuraea ferruginea]